MSRRGDKCLVVQAAAYGKFLGHLSVNFTTGGVVESYSGNPIVMWGEDMQQDEESLKKLDEVIEKVCGMWYSLLPQYDNSTFLISLEN